MFVVNVYNKVMETILFWRIHTNENYIQSPPRGAICWHWGTERPT